MRITTDPIDLVNEEGFSSGDIVHFQVVSAKSAVYLRRTDAAPTAGQRGRRLAFGDPPYAIEVLSSPDKIWAWAEDGPSADLEWIRG